MLQPSLSTRVRSCCCTLFGEMVTRRLVCTPDPTSTLISTLYVTWANTMPQEAQRVARFLGIPLHEADFVAEYWTRVFDQFVKLTSRGLTPNPDLGARLHALPCMTSHMPHMQCTCKQSQMLPQEGIHLGRSVHAHHPLALSTCMQYAEVLIELLASVVRLSVPL